MPRFYFRHYINGRWMAKDQKGRVFASAAEACTYAVRRAPGVLRKLVRPDANTFLTTEVSDGERARFFIRGKVTSEKA
jgi:hypothetical protein